MLCPPALLFGTSMLALLWVPGCSVQHWTAYLDLVPLVPVCVPVFKCILGAYRSGAEATFSLSCDQHLAGR